MPDLETLDKSYSYIINHFIGTGRAPHYTDLAAGLGLPPEQGRQVLRELIALDMPATWLHPGTDNIASFAPFNDFTTQFKITIEGQQKWYGQ